MWDGSEKCYAIFKEAVGDGMLKKGWYDNTIENYNEQ